MMRTIFGLLTIVFLTVSCSQNSKVKLGKQALDLKENPLSVNIPDFFSDEKNFVDEQKTDLYVEVDERQIDNEKGKSIFVVYYDVTKNEKKQKLVKFGNLNFENLELLTDMKDEKTFMISASRDSLTTEIKNNLVAEISEKFGEYEKKDQDADGNYYRWEKDNIVVKVSARSDSDSGYGNYDEIEQSVNQEHSKPDQSVKIFILTKDFETLLKNSYSGMGIFTGYFQ